jgi:hypothetical protein
MSTHTSVTKTSNYRSTIHEKYRANNDVLRRVHVVENDTISHYSKIEPFQKNNYRHQDSKLFQSLNDERDHANKLLVVPVSDLERHIKAVISSYNHMIKIIVQIEEELDIQCDQDIQHFLILHHQQLNALGLSIRQSLYLEYNTIILRSAIHKLTPKIVFERLFSHKGILVSLFKVLDHIILELDNEPEEDQYFGRIIDFKA